MESNITFVYPNRIDECTISDVNNPANWSTKLPLTNIQNRIIKEVARSNIGVRSATLKINLSNQSRPIGGIGIVKHNFTTNAKVRVEGFSGLDFTGTKRFDSTADYRAYPIINPMDNGAIPFESRNWWLGTVEESERKSYTSLCSFYPDDNNMCQSVRITIVDTVTVGTTSATSTLIGKGQKTFTTALGDVYYSGQKITIYSNANPANFMSGEVASCVGTNLILNSAQIGGSGTFSDWNIINGDNYLEIGRIILGKAIEPTYNPEYGDFAMGFADLTEVTNASDCTEYYNFKPRMRVVSSNFKHLTKPEALSGFLDAQRELGISGELMFAFSKPEYIVGTNSNINMTKDANHYLHTFLGHFTSLNKVTHAYYGGYENNIEIKEIV